LRKHCVGYVHLVDNIVQLYRCTDAGGKLIIGSGVFTLKNWRLTKKP